MAQAREDSTARGALASLSPPFCWEVPRCIEGGFDQHDGCKFEVSNVTPALKMYRSNPNRSVAESHMILLARKLKICCVYDVQVASPRWSQPKLESGFSGPVFSSSYPAKLLLASPQVSIALSAHGAQGAPGTAPHPQDGAAPKHFANGSEGEQGRLN